MDKKIFIFLFSFLLISSPVFAFDGPPTAEQIEAMRQNAMQNIPSGTDPSATNPPPVPGNMGPSDEQMKAMEEQQKKGEEAQKKAEQAQLNGMKKSVPSLEKGLATMENNINKLAQKGSIIPDEVKNKIARQKEIIKTIKDATTVDQIESVDMDEFSENMNSLGEDVGNITKLTAIKKAVLQMEKAVISFDKQVEKVKKQGVIIPGEVATNLSKAKTLISTIKNGKTMEEIETAGFYEFDDIMESLNNERENLEYLARWPKIMKEVDKQIAKLDLTYKNLKVKVDALNKKGIDVSDNYIKFNEAIINLKNVKAEAIAKMKEGQGEEALTILEDNFFAELDNVYENQRVIEQMNGLGKFNAEYKKELANIDLRIKALKKKKVNVTELNTLLSETKTLANKVLDLMKAKPIDNVAINEAIENFENKRQAFYDKLDELDTTNDIMVWETVGKDDLRINKIDMTNDFKKMIPTNPKAEEVPTIDTVIPEVPSL